MSPSDVRRTMQELRRRGIELRLVGGEVRYWPKSAMPATLVDQLRAIPKAQLEAEVEARSDPFTATVMEIFDCFAVMELELSEPEARRAGGAS